MKKLIFKKLSRDIGLFFIISTISLSLIIWIIQAVNYLDLVSEDGHSLKIYFLYTFYSFPKIISKILPFIFMISLFYILIKYELNNELIIYWTIGIGKLNFAKKIILISFLYFVFQILLTTIIVPTTLDKGRSFFRSSDIDIFSSTIKEKKFIDTVKNLTIFVENKNNKKFQNIIIKEKISDNKSQIIIAKEGEFVDSGAKKIVLLNGKIINHDNKEQKIINFTEFSLDLSKYNTNTITHPKIQEISSLDLIKCLSLIWDHKHTAKATTHKKFSTICNTEILQPITEETLKRFYSPLFIFLIGFTSSLIIMNNKDGGNYGKKNTLVFLLGILFIFISEVGVRYASISIVNFIIFLLAPFLLFISIYLFFHINNRFKEIQL